MNRRFAAVTVIGLLLAAGAARGDDALKLFLTTPAARPRTGAMMPVEARFVASTPNLMRGRLHLQLREPTGTTLLTWTGPPLALTRGESIVHLTLPPFNANNIDGVVQVEATFQREGSQSGMIDLGIITLAAPTWHTRNTTMLIADPWLGSVKRNAEHIRALRIETIEPRTNNDVMAQRVSTLPARVKPEDLPERPIDYCAYDMVVLIDEGLTDLSQKQIDALRAWVEAGGSVYVAVPGATAAMEVWHEQFVQYLRTGHADHGPTPPHGVTHRRLELGRAAICTGGRDVAEAVYLDPAWRNTVAFLWKLTQQQRRDVAKDGVWSMKRESEPLVHPFASSVPPPNQPPLYQPASLPSEATLIDILQPLSMRLVPFHLIIAVLVGYVLLIGPVEYFVLSRLRARKFTWITFPLITVAVTVATVMVTNDYMGRNDNRRQLVIIDVSRDGRELRRTSIELSVLGRSQTVAAAGRDALMTQPVINRVGFAGYQGYYPPQRYNMQMVHTIPAYDGRVPSNYEMRRYIPQWSPSLLRTTTIDPKPVDVDIDWDRANAELSPLLAALTARPRRGLFSVVSQISPTGGPCLEDLAIGEKDDRFVHARWTVIRRGEDYYAYRRLHWNDGK